MNELCIEIDSKFKIVTPSFDGFQSSIALVRFGSNKTSKNTVELQRYMNLEPDCDMNFLTVINGDMYRYAKVKSLNLHMEHKKIVIEFDEAHKVTFKGANRVVINHGLSSENIGFIKDALSYICRNIDFRIVET